MFWELITILKDVSQKNLIFCHDKGLLIYVECEQRTSYKMRKLSIEIKMEVHSIQGPIWTNTP